MQPHMRNNDKLLFYKYYIMKLDCVLTSVNENALYLGFVPIFIKTWNKLYPNVDVKIILIAKQIPAKPIKIARICNSERISSKNSQLKIAAIGAFPANNIAVRLGPNRRIATNKK